MIVPYVSRNIVAFAQSNLVAIARHLQKRDDCPGNIAYIKTPSMGV